MLFSITIALLCNVARAKTSSTQMKAIPQYSSTWGCSHKDIVNTNKGTASIPQHAVLLIQRHRQHKLRHCLDTTARSAAHSKTSSTQNPNASKHQHVGKPLPRKAEAAEPLSQCVSSRELTRPRRQRLWRRRGSAAGLPTKWLSQNCRERFAGRKCIAAVAAVDWRLADSSEDEVVVIFNPFGECNAKRDVRCS